MSILLAAGELTGTRICLASSAHAPDDDRIFFKEARSLVHAGAKVTIVCRGDKSLPEEAFGVRFEVFNAGKRWSGRVLSINELKKRLADGRYDVIHCHEPDSLIAALALKRRSRVKVVFDSHEMWSAVLAETLPKVFASISSRLYKRLERKWVSRCDGAIGASWSITQYLASILGKEKVVTILNAPQVAVFGDMPRAQWGDVTVLCHDGHLTFDRGLKTMAEAVRLVARQHPVRLKIVGDVFGEERRWLDDFISRNGLADTIQRTGWLPYKEVGKAIASCHIGLIGFQRSPNNLVTSSNKVFNYMLYGLPFLGPDFRLSKQKIVREEQCGVLADSSNPTSYANAICQMIENRTETDAMASRALEASRAQYRWEHMEPKLVSFYRELLASDSENGS